MIEDFLFSGLCWENWFIMWGKAREDVCFLLYVKRFWRFGCER